MRVVGEIYDSNTYLLKNDNDVLIVDASVSTEVLRELVKGKRVVGVLLTHAHFDHFFFLEEYLKMFKVSAYASVYAKEYLTHANKNFSGYLNKTINDFSGFEFLSGDGQVKIGSFMVNFYSLGGHSKSDMCYKIGDEIFVGDLVLCNSIGRLDLYGGSESEMLKSLQKLKKIECKVVHCGHGEDYTKEQFDKIADYYIKILKNR